MRQRSYKRNAVLLGVALGLATPVAAQARDRHERGDDRSTHSDGKCKNADQCQDNDFSPRLTDSPVIVCLPSSTCNFGGDEQALTIGILL